MTAARPLDLPPAQRSALLVAALYRKRDRARKDPAEFFDLCMRQEHSGLPLRIAAHQRLALDFVMHHDRSVLRMPVGFSKTYLLVALSLWHLGSDPSERVLVVSASAEQAEMPLNMARDYITNDDEAYPEIAFTFPGLVRSTRRTDAWQQRKIVVDREPGIRDASIAALGYGDGSSPLPGRRISLAIVDDCLNEANTSTASARAKLNRWFVNSVVDRLDATLARARGKIPLSKEARRYAKRARICVANVPWNPGAGGQGVGDLTYELERAGWPTLTMDAYGDVTIANADPDWDSAEVRPARGGDHAETVVDQDPTGRLIEKVGVYRLVAHDSIAHGAPLTVFDMATEKRRLALPGEGGEPFDIEEIVPAWPERFPLEYLERERAGAKTVEALSAFLRQRRCKTRDEETSPCKSLWIENAKRLAFRAGFRELVKESRSPLIGIGIDLAFGLESKHDKTAIVIAELVPSLELDGRTYRNLRRLLDVTYFREEGAVVKNFILQLARRYPNAIIKVETNGSQKLLRDWILDVDQSIPIVSHVTGASNKWHRSNGVRGVFLELENGAWMIPSFEDGSVDQSVKALIEEGLEYRPPPAHTGDGLIALWLARTLLRDLDISPDPGAAGEIATKVGLR